MSCMHHYFIAMFDCSYTYFMQKAPQNT